MKGFDDSKRIGQHTNLNGYNLSLQMCSRDVKLRNFLTPLTSPKRILDWGCRTGYQMEYMANRGHEVWGLELCEPYVIFGKERGNNIILGDMEKTDQYFEENYFDCVWGHHSLEHVGDPRKALTSLYKVCKSGALIVIHVPLEKTLAQKHQSYFINEGQIDSYIPPEFQKLSLTFDIEWCLTLMVKSK